MDESSNSASLDLIAEVVSAYVSNNSVPQAELGDLIASVATSFGQLSNPVDPTPMLNPAVPIKRSVTPDYIISLEDGLKFKTLKRALMSRYGMTPDEYRARWSLPADYPMVAPNYAAARSAMAKKIGLGNRGRKPAAPAKAARRKTGAA